jgi:hypothetical protein
MPMTATTTNSSTRLKALRDSMDNTPGDSRQHEKS